MERKGKSRWRRRSPKRAGRSGLRVATLGRGGERVAVLSYPAAAKWRSRLSLIDHFDHQGRQFVVAKRPDPRALPRRALTIRECEVVGYAVLGHPNKLIAYELGLAESTVSTHLLRATRKLGARSRVDLIQ